MRSLQLLDIKLNHDTITDEGLAELTTLTNLRCLDMSGLPLTSGKGVASLSHLPIEKLSLVGIPSDRRIEAAGMMQHLLHLDITNPSPTYHCRVLDLTRNDSITDNGLSRFLKLSNPVSLNISGNTKITGAGFSNIAQNKKLTSLVVSKTMLNDVGMKYLSGLQNLKVLDISACKTITDKGIRAIAHLSIKELNIIETNWVCGETD